MFFLNYIKQIFFADKIVKTIPKKCISIYSNHGLIFIVSDSGYLSTRFDASGGYCCLKLDCNDEKLGESIIKAIEKSRFIRPEDPEFESFFSKENAEKDSDYFVLNLLKEFGNISREKAFHKMLHCGVVAKSNTLKISPYRKSRGENWKSDEFMEKNIISIPLTSNNEEIGKITKIVLSNCM